MSSTKAALEIFLFNFLNETMALNSSSDIDIIIVNFNTCMLTSDAIQSIYKETKSIRFKIHLVDNGSSDNSVDYLKNSFPEVNLIESTMNLGFAKANNLASRSCRSDYILLLNPDTIVLDNAIEKLLDFAKNNPANVWGGRTLNTDLSQNKNCCWRQIGAWSAFCRCSGLAALFPNNDFFNSEEYGGWDRKTKREVDIIQGSFLLTTKSHWESLRGFNEKYFLYGEEADFCIRTQKLGGKILFCPNANIIHYGGASTTVESRRIEMVLAGKMQLIKDHYSGIKSIICQFFLSSWPITRILLYRIASIKDKRKYYPTYNQWASVLKNRSKWINGFE